MRAPTRILAALFVSTLAVSATAATGEGVKALDKAPFVGVWRLCYEPGLVGVSELDFGYLIILPDDRYVRMIDTVNVGGSPRVVETGTYEVRPEGVVLHGAIRQGPDGKSAGGPYFKPWQLRYEAERPVVFGKEDKDSATRRAVLLPGANANYGFAKIF